MTGRRVVIQAISPKQWGSKGYGRIKGWDSPHGRYGGDWTIHGALMCIHYDKTTQVAWGGCYTTALDGDIVTWYNTDGSPWYNRQPPLKLISGNYKNL